MISIPHSGILEKLWGAAAKQFLMLSFTDSVYVTMTLTHLHHFQASNIVVAGHMNHVHIARQQTKRQPRADPRHEDAGDGGDAQGHQDPAEDAGDGGDDEDLPWSKDLLKKSSNKSHDDGGNILECSNHGLHQITVLIIRCLNVLLIVFYQDCGEAGRHATRKLHSLINHQ